VRNPGRSAGAVHTIAVWAAQPSTGGRECATGLSSTTFLRPSKGAQPGIHGHEIEIKC